MERLLDIGRPDVGPTASLQGVAEVRPKSVGLGAVRAASPERLNGLPGLAPELRRAADGMDEPHAGADASYKLRVLGAASGKPIRPGGDRLSQELDVGRMVPRLEREGLLGQPLEEHIEAARAGEVVPADGFPAVSGLGPAGQRSLGQALEGLPTIPHDVLVRPEHQGLSEVEGAGGASDPVLADLHVEAAEGQVEVPIAGPELAAQGQGAGPEREEVVAVEQVISHPVGNLADLLEAFVTDADNLFGDLRKIAAGPPAAVLHLPAAQRLVEQSGSAEEVLDVGLARNVGKVGAVRPLAEQVFQDLHDVVGYVDAAQPPQGVGDFGEGVDRLL